MLGKEFQPSLMFVDKSGACPSYTQRLIFLSASIELGSKLLPGTKALAYFVSSLEADEEAK